MPEGRMPRNPFATLWGLFRARRAKRDQEFADVMASQAGRHDVQGAKLGADNVKGKMTAEEAHGFTMSGG